MDNETLVASHRLEGRRPGVRRASVLAALALVLGLFGLVQQPAAAAPKGAPVGISAQTDFREFVCPILLDIRDDFDDAPFFAVALPIIDGVRASFGCIGGTTSTTVAPTTTTIPPTTTTTIAVPPTFPGFDGTFCATLLGIRSSLVNTPFASIIDFALGLFGCGVVSG